MFLGLTAITVAIPIMVIAVVVIGLSESLISLMALPSVLSSMVMWVAFGLNTNIVSTKTLVKVIANLLSLFGLLASIGCLLIYNLMVTPGMVTICLTGAIGLSLIVASLTTFSGLLLRT